MKTNKIKSAIAQLIDGYLELHRTGYGMVNVNTVLEDLENLTAIIDSENETEKKKWIPKFKTGDLFIYNDPSGEAKLYTVKRFEQHGCVAGYWCERLDAPTKGNLWFCSSEEKYMKSTAEEPTDSWALALSKDDFTPKDVFRFNLASCLYNYGKEVAAKCLDTHILDEELNEYVTEADVNKVVERNIELLRRNAGEYEKNE